MLKVMRFKGARALLTGVAFASVMLGVSACSSDDGGADAEAAVRTAIDEQLAAEASGDADVFLAHVTDNWLKTVVGATRDEVKADPSLFQSEDAPEIGDIKVSGNKATVDVSFAEQSGRLIFGNEVGLVKQDGKWKTNEFHVVSAASVPSSAKKVNVALKDFAFDFASKEITSKDDLVFHVTNEGKQAHMMVITKVPANAKLDDILQFEGDGPPPGVEDIGGVFVFSPGDKADVVLKDKLAAGRYLMLCYVSDENDPEHAPHVAKGMVSDFTVN